MARYVWLSCHWLICRCWWTTFISASSFITYNLSTPKAHQIHQIIKGYDLKKFQVSSSEILFLHVLHMTNHLKEYVMAIVPRDKIKKTTIQAVVQSHLHPNPAKSIMYIQVSPFPPWDHLLFIKIASMGFSLKTDVGIEMVWYKNTRICHT